MAELTRRLQILLDPEQMETLQEISRQRRKSVAELIRESVDLVYRPASDLDRKRAIDVLKSRSFLSERAPELEGDGYADQAHSGKISGSHRKD